MLILDDFQDVDEALAEWQLDGAISKAGFGTALAALELAWPQARNNLPVARSILTGLQRAVPPNHHVPLMPSLLLVVAVLFGQYRGGAPWPP